MKKADYLKLAVRAKCYKKKAWFVSAFAMIREDPEAYLKDPYVGRLIPDAAGMRFCTGNPDSPLDTIEDFVPGQPLFMFKERLMVDNTMCVNVKEPVETCIGNVMVNCAVLVEVFGDRFPFVTGRMDVGKMESVIAAKLKDTPPAGEERNPSYYYVDEYVQFVNNLQFISGLSQLSVYSATPKVVVSAPGIKEFKAQLLIKYEGKLNDPVELSKFEKELTDYDEKFIGNDPTNGVILSGRVKANARRKMFLTMGTDAGFNDSLEAKPVTNSLEEGWPTDPKQFAIMMNATRGASYSRGTETVKGGVSAKILLRASSNFVISEDDCGTEVGIARKFSKEDLSQLVGRYVRLNKAWSLVENITSAGNFIDQPLMVRSPMYCHSAGDSLCKACAGMKLGENPNGVSTPITEVAAIILATSMAAMHGKALATQHLDLDVAFS